jgi:hypothetical protein
MTTGAITRNARSGISVSLHEGRHDPSAMRRHLDVVIAALILNLLSAIALTKVVSLPLAWSLFSTIGAGTGVIAYGLWHLFGEISQ